MPLVFTSCTSSVSLLYTKHHLSRSRSLSLFTHSTIYLSICLSLPLSHSTISPSLSVCLSVCPLAGENSDRVLGLEAAGLSHLTQSVAQMAILFPAYFLLLLCGARFCEVWL